MKNKNLFNKILLSTGIIFIIAIFILFILGRINREGYLSELSINTDNTLKLNNIDIESTKKLFFLDDKLYYSSLTNYIFTNSNISNYSYNFRIRYYSKVFRNSDIYGVYLNTNSLPNYIKSIKFDKKGSPFGILTSNKIIEQNIDNIQYILSLKPIIYLIIIGSILLYILRSIIFDFIYFIKIKYNAQNRYVDIVSIFLFFLIMPNIIYKVFYDKFDHKNYENRILSSKPNFNIKNLDKYPVEYEIYFNDYIPFRNELVKLKNFIDIFCFNNIMNRVNDGLDARSFIGKNDYIFYFRYPYLVNAYIGNYVLDNDAIINMKNNLISFVDEIKKKNIDFILMITPDKYNIYSEYMPEFVRRKEKNNYTDIFIDYITKNTDLKVIYLKSELLRYKDKYQLYHKYDLHWNNIASYITYQYLMEYMKKDHTSLDSLSISEFNYTEKIPAYIANTFYITANNIGYKLENYTTNTFIYYNNTNYNHYIRSTSTSSDNTRVLVLGDSFAKDGNLWEYLALRFKAFNYINLNALPYYPSTMELIDEFSPDIIIYQTVELELIKRLSNLKMN